MMALALHLILFIGPIAIFLAIAALLALAPNAKFQGWWILPAVFLGLMIWLNIFHFAVVI